MVRPWFDLPSLRFKATCLALLERVRKTGEPIVVTRFGQPIARIEPHIQPVKPIKLGRGAGTMEILGDIVGADFRYFGLGGGAGSRGQILMRLLLDTNIWLWSGLEPHKLSSEVYQAITDGRNSRFLFSVSICEAILLLEARKIAILQDFGEWLERTRSELELPLDSKVVHEMRFTMLGYKTRRMVS